MPKNPRYTSVSFPPSTLNINVKPPFFVIAIYSSGMSISPASMASMMACGGLPSTWQPTL